MLLLFFYGVPLMFLLVPLLLRNALLLTAYVVVFGGGLTAIYISDLSAQSQPDYGQGAGAGLGAAIIWMFNASFVLGLGLRGAEMLWRYAMALRRSSASKALLFVFLMFAAVFALYSLVSVVIPNWQMRWLIGRILIEFAKSVGGYFLLAWFIASAVLLVYPRLRQSGGARDSA